MGRDATGPLVAGLHVLMTTHRGEPASLEGTSLEVRRSPGGRNSRSAVEADGLTGPSSRPAAAGSSWPTR